MVKLLIFTLILIAYSSYGQQASKPVATWQPPVPVFSQKYDWLKLNSGEWLKGDIISMYDDELEFESDEFSYLTFDWEDVSELRSRFDQQIRFDNGKVKQGFLVVKDQHLILISDGTEKHYPLSGLSSITSSADSRKDLWDGKVSLGIDASKGNVKQLDYIANVDVQRRTPFTRFKVDLVYNYSKSTSDVDDNVITDMTRFTTYLDWFYSYNIFFRLVDYEYYSDLQQNINSRQTVGVSAGYHLLQSKRTQWDVTIGPSFQKTSYYSAIDNPNQASGVLAIGTLLNYDITSRIEYIFDLQVQFVEEDSGKRNAYFKTGVEVDIRHDFELNFMFSLDRVAKPVATFDTISPESNDYKLVLSLGYDF